MTDLTRVGHLLRRTAYAADLFLTSEPFPSKAAGLV